MNLIHKGVLPPDEPDDRDERIELEEALLRKCPFCGGEATLQHGFTYLIGCDTRGCIGYRPYSLDRDYETAYEAVAAWNRRANDE